MKRRVYKAGELPTEMSPITSSGQIVYSRIHQFSDKDDPTKQYIEEFTPNSEDAIKVLEFLDKLNGIGWTSKLKTIEKELRLALLDLMSADKGKQ